MPQYGFDRDTAMKLRKKARRRSTGGVGGSAELLPRRGGHAKIIEFTILTVSPSADPAYAPLNVASVLVNLGPPGLIGETVDVVDHSGQLFNCESFDGCIGWATWTQAITMDTGEPPGTLTPLHWAAINIACDADHMQYHLITDWFGGLALAVRKNMDGDLLDNPYIVVRDPLAIFSYQKSGDKGYMVNECGKYYAWQAPCGNNPSPIPSPVVPPETPQGACCIPKSVPGDNFCEVMTQADCTAAGGSWLGDGTTCTSGICDGVGGE